MTLGEKIEEAIKLSGLSIEIVAGHTGISVATLRRLLKKDSADFQDLIKIAEITNVPMIKFLPTSKGIKPANYPNLHSFSFKYPLSDVPDKTNIKHDLELNNYFNIYLELELCRSENASLIKELKLKDEIIALLKDQLKKV